MSQTDDDFLLSRDDVEQKFGISKRFLELADASGTGPRRIKFGRMVRYWPADIRAWINEHAEGGKDPSRHQR